MDIGALIVAALALWGWQGMPVQFDWDATNLGWAGIGGPAGCTIKVDPNAPQEWIFPIVLHEIGHCVGFDGVGGPAHSDDPNSIMFPNLNPGREQVPNAEEMRQARAGWMRWIGPRYTVVMPGIAR